MKMQARFLVAAVVLILLFSPICFAGNTCTANNPCSLGRGVRYGWSASGFVFWNDNKSSVELTYFAVWTDGDGQSHSQTKTVRINASSYISEFTGYIQDGFATLQSIRHVKS